MSVIDTLAEQNATFSTQDFSPGLPLLPQMRTLMVGCVDPRVDPAVIFGLPLGKAGIMRNIGGRVTPGAVAEIELLIQLTAVIIGAPAPQGDLIVLQHTDCGITRLQNPPTLLAGYFDIDPDHIPAKHVAEPYRAVHHDVGILRANARIAAAYRVHGVVFDVATGQVDVVDRAS